MASRAQLRARLVFLALLPLTACSSGGSGGGGGPASSPAIDTQAVLDTVAVNESVTQILVASGGVRPYSWRVDGGSFPAGLSFTSGDPDASITGRPAVAGAMSFEVTLTDGNGLTDQRTFTLNVLPALAITTAGIGPIEANRPVLLSLNATGGRAPYSFSVASGSLPSGLSISGNTIAGSTSFVGAANLTITVTDGDGRVASRTYTLTVLEPFEFETAADLGSLPVDNSGSREIVVRGGLAPYTLTPASGVLPSGLNASIGADRVTLAGTPDSPGLETFRIEATDSRGATISRSFSLETGLGIAPLAPQVLRLGQPDTITIPARGGSGSGFQWSIVSGALPAGLTLTSGTPAATITGTVNAAVNTTLRLRVIDSLGAAHEQDLELTTGRTWLVYRADQDNDALEELYAVELSGAAPSAVVQINADPVAGGEVASQATGDELFSPDGTKLLYIADQDTQGVDELYLVDMTTNPPGAPVKISGALVSGGDVRDFHWSPDSRRIAFLADAETDGIDELFVVALINGAPGAAVKVSGAMVSGGGVDNLAAIGPGEGYAFSPDGGRLAFLAEKDTAGVQELYVVEPAASNPTPVKVNSALPAGAEVDHMLWAPDRAELLYLSDETNVGQLELFLADCSSAAITVQNVSGALVSGGTVEADPFRVDTPLNSFDSDDGWGFSPDGSLIAFRASKDDASTTELYLVTGTGGTLNAPQRVNGTMPAGGTLESFRFLPDSSGIVYAGEGRTLGIDELFLVRIASGAPGGAVRLNATLAAGGRVDVNVNGNGWRVSPDGRYVSYIADQLTAGTDEVFLVDISGASPATPVRVNANLPSGADIDSAFFSPDGRFLTFIGDPNTQGTGELFHVDLSGATIGAVTRISPAVNATGSTVGVQLSFAGHQIGPSSRYVAIRGDIENDNVFDCVLVNLSSAAPGQSQRLNPSFAGTSQDVFNFIFSP